MTMNKALLVAPILAARLGQLGRYATFGGEQTDLLDDRIVEAVEIADRLLAYEEEN